ncbi:MAG: hypothetical protein AAFY38_07380 [Pseudomonadota bacterium]
MPFASPILAEEKGSLWQASVLARASSSACMVMADVEPKTNSALTAQSVEQFEDGFDDITVSNPEVLARWAELQPSLRQMAAHDLHSVVVGQVLEHTTPLFVRLSELGQPSLKTDPGAAFTLLQSLTQSLSARMCLIAVDLQREESLEVVARVIGTVEAVLSGIENTPGLPPALEDAIWMLRGDWDAIAGQASEIVKEGTLSTQALARLVEEIGMLYTLTGEIGQQLRPS